MRISDWSSDVCSSDLLIEREGEVCVCTGCAQRGRKAVRGANDEFLIIGGCAQRRACSRLGDGHAFVGGAKTGPCRRQAGVRAIGMDQCLSQGLALADAGYGQHEQGDKPFWKPVRSEEHTSELQSLMRI